MIEFSTREEWLKWRQAGLGASDVPIILGLSKFKSPFQLFEEKTGRVPLNDVTPFAAAKGNELEPVARKKFASQYNWQFDTEETFDAMNIEHPEIPYLRASLDGISNDKRILAEIKYQGKQAHEDVLRDKINEAYYAQMQDQLMIAHANFRTEKGILISINDNREIATMTVHPNAEYQAKIRASCIQFWMYVEANYWPGETKDAGVSDLFEKWKIADDEMKKWDLVKRDLQDQIFASGTTNCNGFVVRETTRKGSIKYADIPELQDLDLEKYRSADVTFKTIVRPK